MLSFREYVLLREGLYMPDKPPWPGHPKTNTTPFQNIRRTRTFRPRKVLVARTPRVRKAAVPRVPTVPVV
jgi:hypothetical protein